MNAFVNYQPQLSWEGHDRTRNSQAGTKGAEKREARMTLPGSLRGAIPLIDIPIRDSINTVKTSQRDKTDMIRRGGR
jgi:hypothetical protein